MLRFSSLVILLFVGVFSAMAQAPQASAGKVNAIGPYKLGADYKDVKDLPGFEYDSSRSVPAKGVKAGKIIDRNVFGQPTIQRLIFHKNKLVRVSIIIGDQHFTEGQAKDLVARQWGDPGPKQLVGEGLMYMWSGSVGMIVLLTADGGRQMISLIDNDKTHFVE